MAGTEAMHAHDPIATTRGAGPPSECERVALPDEPADFTAHSVTLAKNPDDVWDPLLDWVAVGGKRKHKTAAPLRRGSRLEDHGSVARYLPLAAGYWGLPAGSTLVMLGCGTVVAWAPDEAPAMFAGFAGDRGTQAAGARYGIPLHVVGSKKDVRQSLAEAQKRLEALVEGGRPGEAVWMSTAAAVLAAAGYPNPGNEASDANVLAAWRVSDEWVSLVGLRLFERAPAGYRVGVLVRTSRLGDPGDWAGAAAIGRNHYRFDYVGPQVFAVHECAESGAA
jgi:hypothetical protein